MRNGFCRVHQVDTPCRSENRCPAMQRCVAVTHVYTGIVMIVVRNRISPFHMGMGSPVAGERIHMGERSTRNAQADGYQHRSDPTAYQ